jgi:hypothetical protein
LSFVIYKRACEENQGGRGKRGREGGRKGRRESGKERGFRVY